MQVVTHRTESHVQFLFLCGYFCIKSSFNLKVSFHSHIPLATSQKVANQSYLYCCFAFFLTFSGVLKKIHPFKGLYRYSECLWQNICVNILQEFKGNSCRVFQIVAQMSKSSIRPLEKQKLNTCRKIKTLTVKILQVTSPNLRFYD